MHYELLLCHFVLQSFNYSFTYLNFSLNKLSNIYLTFFQVTQISRPNASDFSQKSLLSLSCRPNTSLCFLRGLHSKKFSRNMEFYTASDKAFPKDRNDLSVSNYYC